MIANCAAVYVKHSTMAHKAKIVIDYKKCQKLKDNEYYDHGRGVLVKYGEDGEQVIIRHSDNPKLVMIVDLKRKILRHWTVQNLGTDFAEIQSDWMVDQ